MNNMSASSSSSAKTQSNAAEIIEPIGEHRHSIIWFHGFGDSSDGYKDLFTQIRPPNTRIVLPNAPKRYVTIDSRQYHMRSWFDDDDDNDNDDEKSAIDMDCQVMELVKDLIDKEVRLVPNASHIILGGFSQGACLSLIMGLTYTKQKLGGIICCSGQLILQKTIPKMLSEYAKQIPILVLHGKNDNRISWEEAKKGFELLESNGIKSNMQIVLEDGVSHTISRNGWHLLLMFIFKQFQL